MLLKFFGFWLYSARLIFMIPQAWSRSIKLSIQATIISRIIAENFAVQVFRNRNNVSSQVIATIRTTKLSLRRKTLFK